ncbi:MAG: cation:proton antiporter [archaeon]|nr:cation:proton antiporter [archaeon]
MEELALTACMATMLVVAMICTIIFKKIKLPAIVGYLATGIIIANYFSNYDGTNTELIVGLLSNLGLAMELNFDKLRKNGAFSILIVMVQVPLVILAGMLFGSLLGWDPLLSICMGAILSGSSTAVVLVVQKEKQVLDPEAVDALLLILVVEDVAQVIMMSVLTPMLGSGSMATINIVLLEVKIIIFMVLATFVGIRFVPRLLNWIGDKVSNEVLIISSLAMCFLLAFLSVSIGMSMAVGAFLMGVIVSQCRHYERIEHSIEPMKDVFMAMFFISIGLEVKPDALISNLPLVFGILILFIVSRSIAIYLGFLLGNKEPRLSFISATSLVTMGEFAFIISSMAYKAGIMDDGVHAAVIGAALVSMITQSFITGSAGKVYDGFMSKMPQPVRGFNARVLAARDRMYVNFGKFSQGTVVRLKKLLVFAYFSGMALVIVIAVFYYYGDRMVDVLFDLVGPFSVYDCRIIIRVIEFLLLLIPISILISNIKSLVAHATDPEENAFDMNSRREQYVRRSASINLWVPTMLIDSLILLFLPSHLNLLDHVLISIIGIVVFSLVWFLLLKRSFRGIDEDAEE